MNQPYMYDSVLIKWSKTSALFLNGAYYEIKYETVYPAITIFFQRHKRQSID